MGLSPPLQSHFECLSLTQSPHFHMKVALCLEHAEVGTAAGGVGRDQVPLEIRAVGLWKTLEMVQLPLSEMRVSVARASAQLYPFRTFASSLGQCCAHSSAAIPVVTSSSFLTAQPPHTSSPKCPVLLPRCHSPACLQTPSSFLSCGV